MKPQVSILIPVFNRKQFIEECIQSALNQTFTDFEIVIVDNASDDGTWEICEFFARQDDRVKIFRNEKNIGPVRNWRRCAEKARGTLSKILFSDDTIESDCLAKMIPFVNDPNVGLAYCAANIGDSKNQSKIYYSLGEDTRLSSRNFINLVLEGKAPVSPGAILLRTADLLRNLHVELPTSTPQPYHKHGAGPDVMILLLTAESYECVISMAAPLVYFRVHQSSFTIANINNEIRAGYDSAMSYFLFKKRSKHEWLRFVSKIWIARMKKNERWIWPSDFLLAHEGSKNLIHSSKMVIFSFKSVLKILFKLKKKLFTQK